MNYVFGIDAWEGSLDIDEVALKAGGVAFIIPRLNDVNGALHLDANFHAQWKQAEDFLRFPYFVYSPWEGAATNFGFLAAHMPAGCTRVAVDVELKKDGLTPTAYANNLALFLSYCNQSGYRPVVYTGAWFLPNLTVWPQTVEYWWARYPYSVYPPNSQAITWDELRVKLNALPWSPGATPGPCHLWQVTADRYKLPGTCGRAVDINLWQGSLDDLRVWVGETEPDARTVEERLTELETKVASLMLGAHDHGWEI